MNGNQSFVEEQTYLAQSEKMFLYYNKTLEFNETNILKVVDFNKNQMLVFPKTYNSLHSVGPLKGDSKNYYRKSITMNIEKKIIF